MCEIWWKKLTSTQKPGHQIFTPCLHIITKIPTFWEASHFFLQNNIYVYNITYLIQSSDCILFINGQWPVILEKCTVCEGKCHFENCKILYMYYGQKSTSPLNKHHNPIYISQVNTQPYSYTNLMIDTE